MPDDGYFKESDQEIVKVDGSGKLEREIKVGAPEVSLVAGEKYVVKAEGRWMGLWEGRTDKFGFGDGDGSLMGNFESEEVEVVVPA